MNARTMVTDIQVPLNAADTRPLRDAFSRFATGVTIVTTNSDQGPVCITANSFSSISLDPPLVMWAVGLSTRRYPFFKDAAHYAIHVLAAAQGELCTVASKDPFALRNIAHGLNVHNVPLLNGCIARFECRQHSTHAAGDHLMIIGEVTQASVRDGPGLGFFGGQFMQIPT